MEVTHYFLGMLERLAICLLLLQHLLLVFKFLFLDKLQSLMRRIIEVLGLLVHCPTILDLLRLELEMVVLHHYVHLRILVHLHLHLLDL